MWFCVQPPITHSEFAHFWMAFSMSHALPQPPQLSASFFVSVSQPSEMPPSSALSLQFLKPGSHDTTAQVPASQVPIDRKSTRLNSSHSSISYAVFCLKKQTRTSLIRTSC